MEESSSRPPVDRLLRSTWQGDKFFNVYILDYLKKRGYHKAASHLVTEAHIPPGTKPPINAPQGLLFEWWTVFWVIFTARNSGIGLEEAHIYNKYKDQSNLYGQQASQVARCPSPTVVTGTAPSLPANQMNGIGPVGRPAYYGPANPPFQTNNVSGYPNLPGAPGQPFSPSLVNRSPMGQQQRRPNGVSQYLFPTTVPSPRSQGGPEQTSASFPPPNDPQHPQGSASVASAHSIPSPAYQQLVRPQSNNDISSQNHMNPHTLSGRLPPSQNRSHIDETRGSPEIQLTSFTADVVGESQLLATKEKHAIRAEQGRLFYDGVWPPGTKMHEPLQNRGPLAQPMQQQLSMQPQCAAKRSNTSDEEHETLPRNDQSPDRKRLRRTPSPNPAEPQQQRLQRQSQQPQPPPMPRPQQHQQHQPQSQMAPVGLFSPGSLRGPATPISGWQAPLNGVGDTQMHQIGTTPMIPMHAMSPPGPPPGFNPQMKSQLYAQHKNLNVPVSPVGHADPPSHRSGPGGSLPGELGPQQRRQRRQPPNGMGGSMISPGQEGMNALPLPSGKDGEGDMNSGDLHLHGALVNNVLSMNAPRPSTTASAAVPTPAPPLSMPDLRFGMSEMFANGGRDFDFPDLL